MGNGKRDRITRGEQLPEPCCSPFFHIYRWFDLSEGIFWAFTMDSAIQSYLQEENKYAYLTSAQKNAGKCL